MNRDTKRLVIGGSVGALALALGYEVWKHRRALTRPIGVPMEHERHGREHEHEDHEKKHKHHDENGRGEYGRKKREHHEEHGHGD